MQHIRLSIALFVFALLVVGCGRFNGERNDASAPRVTLATSSTAHTNAGGDLRGYLAVDADSAFFIQWTASDTSLSGSMTTAYVNGKGTRREPFVMDSKSAAFTGVIRDRDVTITFPQGLGANTSWIGQMDGKRLRLSIPTASGTITNLEFAPASTADYNHAVEDLRSAVARGDVRRGTYDPSRCYVGMTGVDVTLEVQGDYAQLECVWFTSQVRSAFVYRWDTSNMRIICRYDVRSLRFVVTDWGSATYGNEWCAILRQYVEFQAPAPTIPGSVRPTTRNTPIPQLSSTPTPSLARQNAQTTPDPFEFCRAAGTTDWPVEQSAGAVQYVGPAQPFPGQVWRCWAGKVLGCEPGATAGRCMKVNTSQVPSAELVAWCRVNPNGAPPGAATGHSTVYYWECREGTPAITGQGVPFSKIDGLGYQIGPWFEIGPR